ncbi:MAG: winged helix-turn-helix domain-containing protein, partial [Longimicrobiales bacterium]
MIVLADEAHEALRPGRLSPAADASLSLSLPLDEKELLARLAQLMALPPAGDEDGPAVLSFEGCQLDLAGRTFVDASGHELPLTRSEFELLTAFVRNPHRVLSRDQLRRTLAGHSLEPYERSVDVLVGRLRRKIEHDPKTPRLIVTVSGAGYKFTARAQTGEAAPPLLDGSGPAESMAARSSGGSIALPQLEPEKRQLTVLCAGLVDAESLAAAFDLEDVGGVVRRFQDACTGAITRMDGWVCR